MQKEAGGRFLRDPNFQYRGNRAVIECVIKKRSQCRLSATPNQIQSPLYSDAGHLTMKRYWYIPTGNKVWFQVAVNLYDAGIARPVLWSGDDDTSSKLKIFLVTL